MWRGGYRRTAERRECRLKLEMEGNACRQYQRGFRLFPRQTSNTWRGGSKLDKCERSNGYLVQQKFSYISTSPISSLPSPPSAHSPLHPSLPIETPRVIGATIRQPRLLLLLLLLRRARWLISLIRLILPSRRSQAGTARLLLLPAARAAAALLRAVDRGRGLEGVGALTGGQGVAVAGRGWGGVRGGWRRGLLLGLRGRLVLGLGWVGLVAGLRLLWRRLHLLSRWIGVPVIDGAFVAAGAELLRVAGVQGVDAVRSDLALKCRRCLLLVALRWRM